GAARVGSQAVAAGRRGQGLIRMSAASGDIAFAQHLALPPAARAQGTVTLPGSKSISNRSLLLAALAQGTTTLVDVLAADDTDRMLDALTALGVALRMNVATGACDVTGVGGGFPIH